MDGNGLYDASIPKGAYTFDIFKEQEIDVLCSGNHELYNQGSADNEYFKTVPNSQGNYLASNIDIFDPKTGDRVPLAQRYKKFTTKNQGIRILAFGFLFDFKRNANNTVVKPVASVIKEEWFQEAIRDRNVDLFLVIGHVPLRSGEFDAIYKAIRKAQWDIPIQFFGGHSHIRDYNKYDSKAYALESGRYMETIGFMSIKGLAAGGKPKKPSFGNLLNPKAIDSIASPSFARRYIDNNLFSYYHHTALNDTSFPTNHGRNVSTMISSARHALGLDYHLGCAPQNFWTNRAPFPRNDSIFTWLQDTVIPEMLHDASRGDKPTLAFINTGAIRYDIFKGPFTVDTSYIVSPFLNNFRFIKDVPYAIAKKIVLVLNAGAQLAGQAYAFHSKPPVSLVHSQSHKEDAASNRPPFVFGSDQIILQDNDDKLTPGYTTVDDAGSDGDDTIHSSIEFFTVSNCIESRINFPAAKAESLSEDPKVVDIVYNDFIQTYVLLALEFLGGEYHEEHTEPYMPEMDSRKIITKWVEKNWNGNC